MVERANQDRSRYGPSLQYWELPLLLSHWSWYRTAPFHFFSFHNAVTRTESKFFTVDRLQHGRVHNARHFTLRPPKCQRTGCCCMPLFAGICSCIVILQSIDMGGGIKCEMYSLQSVYSNHTQSVSKGKSLVICAVNQISILIQNYCTSFCNLNPCRSSLKKLVMLAMTSLLRWHGKQQTWTKRSAVDTTWCTGLSCIIMVTLIKYCYNYK